MRLQQAAAVLDQQIRQSDLMSNAFAEARAARAVQENSGNGQQREGQPKKAREVVARREQSFTG